jgi:hypothetical protein
MKVAGIDVHKKVLMVVAVDANTPEENQPGGDSSPCRELHRRLMWLREQGVEEAVIAYASHCTSLGRCETFSINCSLFDSLTPLATVADSLRGPHRGSTRLSHSPTTSVVCAKEDRETRPYAGLKHSAFCRL